MYKMIISEYFDSKGIKWFPINLDIMKNDKGETVKKLEPYKETGYRPTTNDFKNNNIVNTRKKFKYKYGAVDTSIFQHIDIDLNKNKNYSEETYKFVENLKNTVPYFESIGKKNPHFIAKNSDLGNKYRIQTKYEDIEILNKQWSYFEIGGQMFNFNKDIIPIDEGIVSSGGEESPEPIENNIKRKKIYSKKNVDKILCDIVDLIDIQYINDYNIWIKLVWALHNDNINNIEIARNMSMKSSKYEDESFNKLWNNAKEGCNIGTIHFYAMKSNLKKYILLNPNNFLTGTEDNLAKIFMKMSGENVRLCNDIIYLYREDRWYKDNDKNLQLKKMIRETLIEYVKQDIRTLLDKPATEDISKQLEEKQKIFLKVSNKKTIDNVCSFIIQDLAITKNNKSEEEEFDTGTKQNNNLHFENGVYNIVEKKFRKRTKEDYITQILDWEYMEKDQIDNDIYNEVETFYKKLQPNEEQRKFTLSWLAYCLSGDIGKQKFKMNIGYTASNGKSTEFNIHNTCFPIYTQKLDNQTFNVNFANKRHKQIIHLIKNPIRFCYCEELDQKKIDCDFLKDFIDGNKINVEILYGTSETKKIQAKLNTCSNKDFNIDIDEGILRRGLVQIYNSKFKKGIEDNWEKNEYQRIDNYGNKFNDIQYKNAYLHLLLSFFSLNPFIPKKNEELFQDIAEEYDEFGTLFSELIEITNNNNDILHKNDIINYMKDTSKGITFRKITQEFKKKGIKYDKNKSCNGKRGHFIGIKFRQEDIDEDND